MPVCQILQFARTSRWGWRYVAPDGAVIQSEETYTFHYQCASAARMSGYRPESKWSVEN